MSFTNNWLNELSIKNKDLYYKQTLIVGLFFILPVFGFLLFAFKYDLFEDKTLALFLAAFLVFAILGFVLLRNIFNRVVKISKELTEKTLAELPGVHIDSTNDELSNIVESFRAIETHFKTSFAALEKKAARFSTFKELAELCYVTFDSEELMFVTLERALQLVDADIGTILLVEQAERKKFVVQANIGLGEALKVGDRIDFDSSIAKYAVINKSPIVVSDIEKDTRFGRNNRSIYKTKSFICMPIKTINDVIGVVTISRRMDETPFTNDDVELLTPLLSAAAFTYENLRLLKEDEQKRNFLVTVDKMLKVVNSSFKESEMTHSILGDMQNLIPFDLAIILTRDRNRPRHLSIIDFFSREPVNISRGILIPYAETTIERVMNQSATLVVDGADAFVHDLENELMIKDGYKSYLISALQFDGKSSGIFVLCSHDAGAFTPFDEFIDVMGEALGIAVKKNEMYAVLKKRDHEMKTLKEIGDALTISTFDIDQVLKYTMDMIHTLTNVQAGTLFMLVGEDLEYKIAFGTDIEKLQTFRIKMGQGIAGNVASQGRSIIVNDIKQSPHFFSSVDIYTGFQTKSVLCTPLISQGRVIGVIELLNKIDGDFNDDDLHLLESIISSLTIAIENARLYQKTISMTEHERGIRQIFQKFVPEEIVDKIIHGEEIEKTNIDEFRTLTVLNIDIRGFSKLSTRIGPQKTVKILNYFFSIMGMTVFNHHGIVDKYLGDGFLALFGAPVPSTMDADNAISAALEMKKSVNLVEQFLIKEIGTPLAIGISIHTGEVVIGNIGFDKKMDYTVIGDPVNTVFRLQALTKSVPNCILISENTRRAARSRLNLKEMGEYDIDSTTNTLKVYELIDFEKTDETPAYS